MPVYNPGGVATYVTAAGATCVCSSNAQIIGILFQSSATANVQIWAGTTATATASTITLSGIIRTTTGAVSAAPAVYIPFPAYASGGISLNLGASGDPKLTLFWNPAGGA
jgi:hypothetical protein